MNPLTLTPSGVRADHAELISGLETVFTILIDASYVQTLDVQVPPHGLPKDPIAVVQLRAAGLAPETLEIIAQLPCFTNDVLDEQQKQSCHVKGIPVAPTSSATSYLIGPGRYNESRDVGPDNDQKLPATSFKLATATSSQGMNLAYDMLTRTILEWPFSTWSKCERYPVKVFFDEWIRRLRTLDWLPWRNERGWQIEPKIQFHEKDLGNPDSAIAKSIQAKLEKERQQWSAAGVDPEPIENLYPGHLAAYKAHHNRYWAKRRIYVDCGWPETFDRDRFAKLQSDFNKRATEVGASDGSGEEQAAIGDELREFYRGAAGQHAV